MLRERPFKAMSGWPVLPITLLIFVAAVYLFVNNVVGANSGGHFSLAKMFSSLGLLAVFIISLPIIIIIRLHIVYFTAILIVTCGIILQSISARWISSRMKSCEYVLIRFA